MNFLCRLFCGDITQKLSDLETKNIQLTTDNTTLRADIHIKNLEVARLEKQVRDLTPLPNPSKPTFLGDGYIYKPVITSEIDNFHLEPTLMYPTEGLNEYRYLWTNVKSRDQVLTNIWKFVIDSAWYTYDKVESWQFPQETIARKKGDCEDTTILFVALCRQAGIPPTDVFNALGWLKVDGKDIGHSWPIAKGEDGNWYIYESTLETYPLPTRPMLFKGSPYRAEWGFHNWAYAGSLKDGGDNGWQM